MTTSETVKPDLGKPRSGLIFREDRYVHVFADGFDVTQPGHRKST